MKITKKELQFLIKESIFDAARRKIAGTFDIESMKDTPRAPLNPVQNTALKIYLLSSDGSSGYVFLYQKTMPNIQPTKLNVEHFCELIGYINFEKTSKPCITNNDGPTIQVNSIAVTEDFQNQGYGSLLYGILFQYAKDNGFGVTSDHNTSTSSKAKEFWNTLPHTNAYKKRKTSKDNDVFDYEGKTPDRDDDCNPGLGYNKMGTHHSWEITTDHFKSHMNSLLTAHEAHVDFLLSHIPKNKVYEWTRKDMDKRIGRYLARESTPLFRRVYNKNTVQVQ